MFLLFLSIVIWSALSNAILHAPAQVQLSPKQPLSAAALLEDITVDKLSDRAKDLSEFAQFSVEKYGHPTRVIGSPGKEVYSPAEPANKLLKIIIQGIMLHSIISTLH